MANTPLFAQIRKTFLKQPMASTDISFLVNSLTDCYGNLMTIGTLGNPFYFTISPGGSDEEICSATSITQNADTTCTISGVTRGLSAVTTYNGGGTPQSHGASTPVVFMPDNPQLLNSIISYINSLVLAAAVQATDTTVGYVNTSITPNSLSRVQSVLVSQQSSPGTTVYVNPFATVGANINVQFAGGSSPALANPTTNPRVDLIVYSTTNAQILVRQGTENASLTTSNWATYAPSPVSGDIVLAAIFNRHVSGSVTVKDRDDSINAFIIRWYEAALYITGTYLSSSNITFGADQSQTTSNGTQAVGQTAGGTNATLVAQSFIPTTSSVQGITLWKIADTGTFTGTVKISLQATSSGNPSGTDLASYTITNAAWLLLKAAASFEIAFSSEYSSLAIGSTYWVVVTTSTTDSSNHPNLGINTAGGYSSGALEYYNGTTWVTVATSILYFQEITGIKSKIVQTDSTGSLPLYIKPYSFLGTDNTTSAYQIPGGIMGLNGGLHLIVVGTNGTSGAGLTVKYNGTTAISFSLPQGSNTGAANVTAWSWRADIYILNQTSYSSQASFALMQVMAPTSSGGSGNLVITGGTPTITTGTSTIDTLSPAGLTITLSGSAIYTGSILEKIG